MKKTLFLIFVALFFGSIAWGSSADSLSYLSEYIATHSTNSSGNIIHTERTAPGTGTLTLIEHSSLMNINATGFYPSSATLNCTTFGRIAFACVLDREDASATFRVVFYDSAGVLVGMSDEYVTGTPVTNDYVRYDGEEMAVDTWTTLTAYELGDKIIPTAANDVGDVYNCTTAGTTGAGEPSWNTGVGTNVADSTVVWTSLGKAEFICAVPDRIVNDFGAASFKIFIDTVPTNSAELSIWYSPM